MLSLTVSQARSTLPGLLNRVESGEEILITRHGRPVAVLVRPDAIRNHRARPALDAAERVRTLLIAAAAEPQPTVAAVTAQRAEELIRDIRVARDAR